MKILRILAAAFLAVAAVAGPARATTFTTDYTDLWWTSPDGSEDGWGVNVIQQDDILFVTLFVFGPDGSPRWYVGPSTGYTSSSPGVDVFTGILYSTSGTWFGAPWNNAARGSAPVGNITFTFTSPTSAILQYNVGTQPVEKLIKRQTFRGNDLSGNYYGGVTANGTNCGGGVSNGPVLINGEMAVGHSNVFNPTFRVNFFNAQGQAGTCTYVGAYAQEGKMGQVDGTFTCQIQGQSNPPAGNFSLRQIEPTRNGFTARYTATDQFCTYDGYFGGLRDVI